MRLFRVSAWYALGVLLLACSSDPERISYAYLRSPSFFRADTTLANHPFCDQSNPLGSAEACKQERKYILTWLRPEDTAKLIGYRIYLDTAPDDKRWNSVKDHPELASVIINRHPLKDSLVFVFTTQHRSSPDTLDKDEAGLIAIDSTGRTEPGSGRLMFGLVPVYSGDATPGQPQFAYFITTDRQPPDVFHPEFQPLPHGFSVAWERPTDRVSFFNPSMDTGIIAGYVLEVGLEGGQLAKRRKSFQPKLKFYRAGDSAIEARDSVILKDGLPEKVRYSLPDGRRAAKHIHPEASDSLRVEVEGLFPQDTLRLMLWAVDSAGNANDTSMDFVKLRTTDTTQPSMPKLGYRDLGQNSFTIVWSASRDSVAGPEGRLQEAGRPNANIMDYRFTRVLVRPPGEKTASLDRFDTTLQMDSILAKQDTFRLPARFLPPGASYRLSLFAEDSSGYPSRVDTITVTTKQVAFADSDSALTCPPGFVPMPRATFVLGDTAAATGDEQPNHRISMAPFCIEPYEHRDSTGQRFVSNVTYEQAEAICRAIDSSRYDTRLCSEAEWERACEGPVPGASALLHGIQSEGGDPSILQTSCNQATSDSAMAMSFALRNSVCLTTEGVYDMAGNLSEWVRDTYAANAYTTAFPNAQSKDTVRLDHDFAVKDTGTGLAPHSIRGGNYLKPANAQLARLQSLARCNNRDFPEQIRPVFRQDCRSESRPKLVVIYGTGTDNHRCYDLPSSFQVEGVTDLLPASKDSTKILVFRAGIAQPEILPFQPDSAFKGRKPLSARLTTKALAVVSFERTLPISSEAKDSLPDTLDATEFRDTSQAAMEAVFRREASNTAWTARKEGGKYAIKYLYGYTEPGSKPALPYYSSRAIGFRCCSRAAKAAAPTDSIAANP